MSKVITAGRSFDLGFQSDIPRDQLPNGAVYRMRDYIPSLGAPLRKRGGWTHATKDLSSVQAGFSRCSGVAWAPFAGDNLHLVVISDDGKVFRVTKFDGSDGVLVGSTAFSPLTHRPFWHKDRLIIVESLLGGNSVPHKYFYAGNGVYSLAEVAGSPPRARVGLSWGDYLVFANGYIGSDNANLFENRLWFSNVGDADSYNTGTSFIDAPQEILRIAYMRNVLITWGYENTWLYTGDTPPPGGNMARRDLFSGNGCMDGRSLVLYLENAFWANNSGIWKTDGTTLTNLTERGGILQYWRSLVGDFNFRAGWSASAGVIYHTYVITIFDNNGNLVTTLLCDIDREVWYEAQNVPAAMYAERVAGPGTNIADGHEELFFAHRTLPRAEMLSACWSPSSANASDADGKAVLPEVELPFYKFGASGLKRVRRAYVSYDLRSAGASPTLRASAVTSPEQTNYVDLSPALAATTEMKRKPVDVRKRVNGVGLKIVQEGASADTRFYDVGFEGHSLDDTK